MRVGTKSNIRSCYIIISEAFIDILIIVKSVTYILVIPIHFLIQHCNFDVRRTCRDIPCIIDIDCIQMPLIIG